MRENNSSGRVSLGYWGWMSKDGPGELTQITPPCFNARAYVGLLKDVFLPTGRTIYPEEDVTEIVLVQDNSSIHRANIVLDWFEVTSLR